MLTREQVEEGRRLNDALTAAHAITDFRRHVAVESAGGAWLSWSVNHAADLLAAAEKEARESWCTCNETNTCEGHRA